MKRFKKRFDFINHLIRENNYASYIEIGVDKGQCFNKVICANKIGADPNSKIKNKGKESIVDLHSDDFFEVLINGLISYPESEIDLIFIDGDHTAEQVEKDIVNAYRCLSDNGMILLHDINPPTRESQEVPKVSSPWKGTVWRAWVGFIKKYPEIEAYTTNHDTGIGVIHKNPNVVPEKGFISKMKWETFVKRRNELLNLK